MADPTLAPIAKEIAADEQKSRQIQQAPKPQAAPAPAPVKNTAAPSTQSPAPYDATQLGQ